MLGPGMLSTRTPPGPARAAFGDWEHSECPGDTQDLPGCWRDLKGTGTAWHIQGWSLAYPGMEPGTPLHPTISFPNEKNHPVLHLQEQF